jgi:hypothetical protein
MRNAGSFAIAVHINHEVLAAALLIHTIRLLAGIANRAPNGTVIPLQNVIHYFLSLACQF